MQTSQAVPNFTQTYLSHPAPNFSFQEKSAKLNWQQIEEIDIQKMMNNTDLETLEGVLSNLTYSQLDKDDLKRIKDKNLIKLFKLGQLSTEYLLYSHKYLEDLTGGQDAEYQHYFQKSVDLEA
jgi:hypothetical protein